MCNFALHKKIVMITLTFPWLVALVVLLFLAIFVLMARFKSPMRKWLCFGLSFISIAYLLYVMMWHPNGAGQPLDWYLLGGVGVLAALVLAGVGFMDLVKPITNIVSDESQDNLAVLVNNENKQTDSDAVNDDAATNADNTDTIIIDDVNKDVYNEEIASSKEEVSADATETEEIDDVGDETDNELKDDAKDDNKDALTEEERMQREELIGKVMPWFLAQLNQYGVEERNAIKVCAIDFVKEGKFSSPTVAVQNNKLYSHSRIIEICSALYLIGDDNNACVDFIKEVFAEPFANTEESTILKKLSGPDKMLEIIDTYWEAQGIKVEKTRLFPKK